MVGEGFVRLRILTPDKVGPGQVDAFYRSFACPDHHLTMGEMEPYYFAFNEPSSACPTCLGLGIYLHVHTDLLVPDKSPSSLETSEYGGHGSEKRPPSAL